MTKDELLNYVKASFSERNKDNPFKNYLIITINEDHFCIEYAENDWGYSKKLKFKIYKADLNRGHYKNIITCELIKLIGILCLTQLEDYLNER